MTPAIQQRLVETFAELRDLSPDIRFGQLLANLGFLVEDRTERSLGDIEDAQLLEVMEAHWADLRRRPRTDFADEI